MLFKDKTAHWGNFAKRRYVQLKVGRLSLSYVCNVNTHSLKFLEVALKESLHQIVIKILSVGILRDFHKIKREVLFKICNLCTPKNSMPAQNLDHNYVYVQRKLLFYNWVITKNMNMHLIPLK